MALKAWRAAACALALACAAAAKADHAYDPARPHHTPDGFRNLTDVPVNKLLAIGASEPRWYMKEMHMNPAGAVRAHAELGARLSLGIHWGTFQLTDEPLGVPGAAAKQ